MLTELDYFQNVVYQEHITEQISGGITNVHT